MQLREVSGYHSGVAEDSSLLGCDTVLLSEWFATFRRIIVP